MKIFVTIWVTLFMSWTATAQSEIASARVAGMAATVQSIDPSLTPDEVSRVVSLIFAGCEPRKIPVQDASSGSAVARVAGFTAALIATAPRLSAEQAKDIAILAFSESTCGR